MVLMKVMVKSIFWKVRAQHQGMSFWWDKLLTSYAVAHMMLYGTLGCRLRRLLL